MAEDEVEVEVGFGVERFVEVDGHEVVAVDEGPP